MQELRCEIGAVRPDYCVQFRMQANALEHGDLAEWFEDRPIELFAQVDFAGKAIAEPKPDHVVSNVSRLDEPDHHSPPDHSSGSSGSIRFSGYRFLASYQFSSSSGL